MTQLTRQHSQVRVATLLAIDQLFERSHCFRSILVNNRIKFQKFLELILGITLSSPEDEDPVHVDRKDAAGRIRSKIGEKSKQKEKQGLPPPKAAARQLRKLSLETLKKWHDKFGSGYPILRSAYEYLVKDGFIDLPGQRIRNHEQIASNLRIKQFAAQQLKARMERICNEYDDFKANDVKPIVDEINTGIELLIPRDYLVETTVTSKSNMNSLQHQEHALNKNNEISLTLDSNSMSISKTNDTEDIIRNVKDQAKLLVRLILPKLKQFMSRLSEGTEHSESTLKNAIDLKGSILKTLSKLSQLGILIEDDKSNSSRRNSNKSKEHKSKKRKRVDQEGEEEKDGEELDADQEDEEDDDEDFIEVPEKPELQDVIAQHERHLYGLETSTCTQKEGETSKQFESQGRRCRAPLPSGKLCPRQDAVKCPFHGLIIERGPDGGPVNELDRIREEEARANRIPEWQDPQYLRDLEAQLGIDLTIRKRKKAKIASLSELKNEKNSRQRIMEKVFSKSSQLKVASDLDSIESANQKQFGDNWNYAMNT